MAVEVELLKGPAKGTKKVISDARARAFVKVGFARVLTPESNQEETPAAPAVVVADPEPVPAAGMDESASGATETAVEPAPDISPRTGLPRRQYRRRDVVAED